ncbi:MAG: dTDP-4-dehydrorhamnose reductase [Acidobacteria bacterium]|nr:dTDP-4-dehydrorhamnose reductase [Acidobacteriota bacterium]
MRVLLIGANGQLGTDLRRTFEAKGVSVVPLTHADADVCDSGRIGEIVSSIRPDAVVNTAAFHKVEECEKQPERAYQINSLAVRSLAQACERAGATLVHFSTDYVFGGGKGSPYEVEDAPNPVNVYGASKVSGEHLIAFNIGKYFTIRTCGLYGLAGSSGKGGNFVENMLKRAAAGQPLRVVDDQVLTPTYTADLARTVLELMQTTTYGLYHITSGGQCSWYEFTCKMLALSGSSTEVSPVRSDDFPSPVKRPAFSVLSKNKLYGIGLERMPHWEDALDRYLQARRARAASG